MGSVVTVEHLRKAYGATVAVADLSFTVEPGEIFGLLGRNGAGKTTTVECLQGLRQPDGGTMRVLDLDPVTQHRELRRRVGTQLQDSALPDRMKVREALELFAAAAGSRDWRGVAEQWGLTGQLACAFGALSGGQRQRLFVALALVGSPELVFLDELTTGLDPAARRTAWQLVEQIRAGGTTVVLVTHVMEEAERLCDRLLVVHAGRVVATGSPAELVEQVGGGVRVVCSAHGIDPRWLAQLPYVRAVRTRGHLLEVDGDGPVLAYAAAALVAHGIAPPDLHVERRSLEDAFLALTGSALRDADEETQ